MSQPVEPLLLLLLNQLGLGQDRPLCQRSWDYMSDSFRLPLLVWYRPEELACAVIHMACLAEKDPRPIHSIGPWWTFFDVRESTLKDIITSLEAMYQIVGKKKSSTNERLY